MFNGEITWIVPKLLLTKIETPDTDKDATICVLCGTLSVED